MTWIDSIAPEAPVLSMAEGKLQWQSKNTDGAPERYVIYRFASNEPIDLERNDRIISILQDNSYKDPASKKGMVYVVTALDRMWNESKASNAVKM
jgi:hypothetical protein